MTETKAKLKIFEDDLFTEETNKYVILKKVKTGKVRAEYDLKKAELLVESGQYVQASEFEQIGFATKRKKRDKEEERKERGFDTTKIREDVLTHLVKNEKREATELLVDEIKKNYKIYTIRDDEFTEMWIYSEGTYIPQGKTIIKEFCRKILGEVYTTTLCNEVIDKISVDTYVDNADFFNVENTGEIAVENGILNILTRELSEFTSDKIFFVKLPVTYNPDKKCPNIEKHFDTILKTPKTDKPIIKEIFGFLLLKEYKIEKAFMFCGTGRNGKGKTLELMKRFVGIENCANIPLQQFETDHFSIGELFKKMVNLGGDIDNKALSRTSIFKQLTGRDLISAARKFKPRVHFVNYAKLVFCANELPVTYDQTPAFFNRWVLLDFPYTFLSKKEIDNTKDKIDLKVGDPSIIDKLTSPDELSGLLNCALDSLKVLLKQRDFSYSKTAQDVKKIWLRKSSSLNGFIMDELVEDWDSRITKKEFRRVYAMYCRKHKLRSVGDKILKDVLAEQGVSDERVTDEDGKQVRCWSGFKFRQGSQGSHGISTYTGIYNLPIGKNTMSNLTKVSKKQDSELIVEHMLPDGTPLKEEEK